MKLNKTVRVNYYGMLHGTYPAVCALCYPSIC